MTTTTGPATEIQDEIKLGSRLIRYTIRRSNRARRLSMRMLPGKGLEVVLPRGFSLREAAAFVRREQRWVLKALDRPTPAPGPVVEISDGASLPYLGETLTLRIDPGRTRVRRDGDVLLVPATVLLPAVEAWYRAAARTVLRERAEAYAELLGVSFRRMAIKDTRSRWGSCSSKGNLNFSWRLMLAPREVMDYVVAHEVAHLRELNHSPAYWTIVESICPDYRTHRAWLRTNGRNLATWPAAHTE